MPRTICTTPEHDRWRAAEAAIARRILEAFEGQSVRQIAERLGTSPEAIRVLLLMGGVIPLQMVARVAEQTGVSLDWLVLGTGSRATGRG